MVVTKNIAFGVRLSDATTRPVPVEPPVDHTALERERFDKLMGVLERRANEATTTSPARSTSWPGSRSRSESPRRRS